MRFVPNVEFGFNETRNARFLDCFLSSGEDGQHRLNKHGLAGAHSAATVSKRFGFGGFLSVSFLLRPFSYFLKVRHFLHPPLTRGIELTAKKALAEADALSSGAGRSSVDLGARHVGVVFRENRIAVRFAYEWHDDSLHSR
jgi:hypothetical protein